VKMMGKKLSRGIDNLLTGWIEVPHQMQVTTSRRGILPGATWGFFRGMGFFLARTCVGLYESITFFIPHGPVMEPMEQFYDTGSALMAIDDDYSTGSFSSAHSLEQWNW